VHATPRAPLVSKTYVVRAMVAMRRVRYSFASGFARPLMTRCSPRFPFQPSFSLEIHMSSNMQKINKKLDKMADKAKDGAEKVAEKVIDSVNDVAHAAAEKARQKTEQAGEKLIEAGEKITKMAK
jgi:hypothetical protein